MGIDPGEVILTMPGTTADLLYPDPDIRYLFLILPVILPPVFIIRAYMKGRVPGRAASVLPAWLDSPFSFPPCQHSSFPSLPWVSDTLRPAAAWQSYVAGIERDNTTKPVCRNGRGLMI